MRAGELFGLLVRDVIGDLRSLKRGTLAVLQVANTGIETLEEAWQGRLTKTGKQDDTIVLDNKCFVGLDVALLRLASKRGSDELLFAPLDYTILSKRLVVVGSLLGLSIRPTPHMARHGGATESLHREWRSVYELQMRARWAQLVTAQRYTKAGKLIMLEQKLSEEQLCETEDLLSSDAFGLCQLHRLRAVMG